jgi:hypothetical protein
MRSVVRDQVHDPFWKDSDFVCVELTVPHVFDERLAVSISGHGEADAIRHGGRDTIALRSNGVCDEQQVARDDKWDIFAVDDAIAVVEPQRSVLDSVLDSVGERFSNAE